MAKKYVTTTLAESVADTVDDYVQGGFKKAGRGMLEVAVSGFGKGFFTAAALVIAATVVGAVIWPEIVLGAAFANASVAACVEEGMITAGNFLLGNAKGIVTLIAGGAVGSLTAAHEQNKTCNKENAEVKAKYYEMMRTKSVQPALNIEPAIAKEDCGCKHQDQLADQRAREQQMQAGR